MNVAKDINFCERALKNHTILGRSKGIFSLSGTRQITNYSFLNTKQFEKTITFIHSFMHEVYRSVLILKLQPMRRAGHIMMFVCMQQCPSLWDPVDCSLPESTVCGILQARILDWVAISYSREFSRPRDRTGISCGSCTAGRFFTTELPGKRTYNDR